MSHECQTCNAELITDGLTPGQPIRCAQCLSIATFGQLGKSATDRLAWRSLWLGIASILLLFITGIPAIYYGVRSLLRMRFVKPKPGDRIAAVAGTALGGCFGLCIGSVVALIAILSLVLYLTSIRTFEPTEVVAHCASVFEFETLPEVQPISALVALNSQYYFEFGDSSDKQERHIRVHLAHQQQALSINRTQFVNQLRRLELNSDNDLKEIQHEILQWEFCGKAAEIKKTVLVPRASDHSVLDAEPGREVHHYFGYVLIKKHGMYGMMVTFDSSEIEFSEDQVRAMFASTRAKMDSDGIEAGSNN